VPQLGACQFILRQLVLPGLRRQLVEHGSGLLTHLHSLDADANIYAHVNANAHVHADLYANFDIYPDADANVYTHFNGDLDADGDEYANTDVDGNTNIHANAD
jgi:hypothetical protein